MSSATTPPETIHAYDLSAEAYHQRWSDRAIMAPQLARFVALVQAHPAADRWVVDVGCGPGFDAAALQAAGLRTVGVDLSAGMLQAGRRRYAVPLVQADMVALPLRSGAAGLWVNAALLHLPRPLVPAALSGFARLLRPGGVLFLSLKQGTGSDWQPTLDGRGRRLFTYWTAAALQPLLNEAGFAVLEAAVSTGAAVTWLTLFARRSGN